MRRRAHTAENRKHNRWCNMRIRNFDNKMCTPVSYYYYAKCKPALTFLNSGRTVYIQCEASCKRIVPQPQDHVPEQAVICISLCNKDLFCCFVLHSIVRSLTHFDCCTSVIRTVLRIVLWSCVELRVSPPPNARS